MSALQVYTSNRRCDVFDAEHTRDARDRLAQRLALLPRLANINAMIHQPAVHLPAWALARLGVSSQYVNVLRRRGDFNALNALELADWRPDAPPTDRTDRTDQTATPRSARRSPKHRQPRFRDSAPYSPTWCGRGAAAQLGGSLFVGRSTKPSSAAWCACHRRWHQARFPESNSVQCAHTAARTDVAMHGAGLETSSPRNVCRTNESMRRESREIAACCLWRG